MNTLSDYKVVKRNVLNELRSSNMTLQQLRLFSLYLARIDPRNISTREVRFNLKDYCQIMGLEKLQIDYIQASTNDLLSKVVNIPNENGKGYIAFQLFKECVVYEDEKDKEWYIKIDAHDNALPLMFDFQKEFFTYKVWNVLSLKSPNQIRMYEILKQYENLGTREISINDLRELLGIVPEQYVGRKGWSNFKTRVIDSCQKALKESTDICFDYERGSAGPGGSWQTIIFHIKRNDNYISNLSIEEFLRDKNGLENEQTTIDKIAELCRNLLGKSKLTGIENNWIQTWVIDYGVSEDLVKEAFNDNAFRSYLSLQHVNNTLLKWHDNGIRTIEAAKKFCQEEHEKNKRKAAKKSSISGTKWKTGAEARLLFSGALSEKNDGTVEEEPAKPDKAEKAADNEKYKKDDGGIPGDILDMFGEDVDDNVDI